MTKKIDEFDSSNSQAVLNHLILDYMREQKRKRFWRWFFRIFIIFVVFGIAYQMMAIREQTLLARSQEHVGLIDIKGTIFDSQLANGDDFAKSLKEAYSNKNMKAVVVRINSPGGSPVQADYMYNSLQYYRKKHPNIKTYAVCVDACASAAYYVAAGTDEIYANPSSLVGSIGVLYNGFGFVDLMQKVGVSRRLYTAGQYKDFLDPFSPEKPGSETFIHNMLNIVHQQFIDKVKKGRGKRLIINDDTFSGLFWTGEQAKKMGLIDGFASTGELSRDVIKMDKIIDYTHQENVLERFAKTFGAAAANQLPEAIGITPGLR